MSSNLLTRIEKLEAQATANKRPQPYDEGAWLVSHGMTREQVEPYGGAAGYAYQLMKLPSDQAMPALPPDWSIEDAYLWMLEDCSHRLEDLVG